MLIFNSLSIGQCTPVLAQSILGGYQDGCCLRSIQDLECKSAQNQNRRLAHHAHQGWEGGIVIKSYLVHYGQLGKYAAEGAKNCDY